MTGADQMGYWFGPSSEDEAIRLHYASMRSPLAQETVDNAFDWCQQTAITANNDAYGPVGAVIDRFGAHMVAHALAHGDPELLAPAAHAGLLLATQVGDNPRAQADGTRNDVLWRIIEAAPQLGTTLEAVVPTEPSDIITTLVEQAKASHTGVDVVVLVDRWGTPFLAPIWYETLAANRPPPFGTFDWRVSSFPWEQIGPVTVPEPVPGDLTAGSKARRLATEFARTGDVGLGLDSVRVAIDCGHDDPLWMGLWVANHHGGTEAVAAFRSALAHAELPTETAWTPSAGAQVGDIVVTDPWAGPFFDVSLPVGR